MKTLKILIFILIIYQIMIPLFVLGGSISFGLGLGDLAMLIISCIAIIGAISLYIWNHKTKNRIFKNLGNWILFAFCLFMTLYLTASFTIWRGSEYSWNGEIFYPSSKQKIEHQNQRTEIEKKLKTASTSIDSNLTNFDGFMERARINKDNLSYHDAIKAYLCALKIDSLSLSANLEIGETYWNLENLTMALKYNEKALAIDTGYFLAKHRVKILRQKVKN